MERKYTNGKKEMASFVENTPIKKQQLGFNLQKSYLTFKKNDFQRQ